MPRIQPIEPPYSDSVQRHFTALMPEGVPPLKLFRTIAHNPRVLRSMHKGGLLDPGAITIRQRELMILRTCALCGARYEWGVHAAAFANAAGLEPETIEATATRPSDDPGWTAEDRLLLELCDHLHTRSSLSDTFYAQLAQCFDAAQILELTALAGLYHAVSFLVNTSGVEPEPWAYPWPSNASQSLETTT